MDVPRAPLEETPEGRRPAGPGWFVLGATEQPWVAVEGAGRCATWEGPAARFAQLGLNVHVLAPGEPSARYHREPSQEDFLVVAGEVLAVVEGEEVRLGPWDLLHCPPGTDHVLVGAGDGPAVVVMVGVRTGVDDATYVPDPVALRHGAASPVATTDPDVAYAGVPPEVAVAYRPGDLPGA